MLDLPSHDHTKYPHITEWNHVCEENVPKYGAVIVYVNNGVQIYWKYVNPDELSRISKTDDELRNESKSDSR